MASLNKHIKIHEQCKVSPSSSSTQLSLPLTFFDYIWLRFHPVERIFFYTLPSSHSHPTFFFENLVPKLKSSLSLTLQHFLPLAGNIVWPSDSPKPFLQFNPNDDGVSLLLAQCDDDDVSFDKILEHNSPQEASLSRSFVPHLESSDSFASIISIQITLFPKNGFSIGISTHHAVLDGKSSTMFIKAWSSICKSLEEETQSLNLEPLLEPFLERELIEDPNDFENSFINTWNRISSHFDKSSVKSIKIMSSMFQPIIKDAVRETFELTREDLEKINKRVFSKWNNIEDGAQEKEQEQPKKLSTFVLTCAYVSVCIAKAIQQSESDKKQKFSIGFPVDCRSRLVPPIPKNYCGNCVSNHIVDTEPYDFTKEDGVVIVAKKIYGKTQEMDKGFLDGIETMMYKYMAMIGEGVKGIGVAGSTRFGVYEIDFGFGRPAKVEITSIDRGLTIGLTESKDLKGGVEIGLVLEKHVMDLFQAIFREGLCFD
ncbi:phenolic glucoside malonyltransferase 1 [Medicago truncatula]|uniref:Anthocyanin 5-aromatic acyltransferase n=1 Tax=Medicago truncatula TaxID=3880 RepID=B4Y0U1_MEDTR|nr:phenolic glucoside malonyltransferase 1 [Medicago truncatula]ABY91221.1 isoflavonoid malonyl transferase 3 [Medicago truncatula]KEH21659.1 anthocyanin 5-aromatic acyltransferase [Medicago truncatula]